MSNWNLKDNKKMMYHHMSEDEMYLDSDIDTLMNELLTSCSQGKLTTDRIYELFGEINTESMKVFWNKRAESHSINESLTNLQDDQELLNLKINLEQDKVDSYININKDTNLLDLGCGYGNWSFKFAKKCKYIDAVDYCDKLISIGRKRAEDENINNITFYEEYIQKFSSDILYDTIFVSGVFIYLNDKELNKTLKNIKKYSKKGTEFILRDSIGINDRYVINNEFSEKLKTNYSAIYRTKEEIVHLFNKIGFNLVKDENMFKEDSPLNLYDETRLHIFKFIKV